MNGFSPRRQPVSTVTHGDRRSELTQTPFDPALTDRDRSWVRNCSSVSIGRAFSGSAISQPNVPNLSDARMRA